MSLKGISRIDSRNTHGWFVRVYRDGQVHSKMFSDGVHGGGEAALKAARKYLADYVRRHPQDPASARVKTKPQSNSKTGVVGVSETYHSDRQGMRVPCFSVAWAPQVNVRRNKCFYYHHYGSRKAALDAAIAFRKEREAEIIEQVEASGRKAPRGRKAAVGGSPAPVSKRKGAPRKRSSKRAVK